MEKRNTTHSNAVEGRVVHTHWKASAVVEDDSKRFASELEQVLNDRTAEGYVLSQLIVRTTDNGLVLVHQKHTFVEVTEEGAAAAGTN